MLVEPTFESSEKKIEVTLRPGIRSLREFPHEWVQRLVDSASAKIVSSMKTQGCDAYILSESSLFVFDRKLVMVTCGTSTLVQAALIILESIPIDQIQTFQYKRQQENYPWMQDTTFHEDAAKLNRILPGQLVIAGAEKEKVYGFVYGQDPNHRMASVEIILKDVNKNWYPGFLRQDFSMSEHYFRPIGYSMNAVSLSGECYSIHLNPEKNQINASFQGSFLAATIDQVIFEVCKRFQPKSASIFKTSIGDHIQIQEFSLTPQTKSLPDADLSEISK